MADNPAQSCERCGLYSMCFFGRIPGLRIRRTRVDRGTALFRHGKRVDALFVIRSGSAKEVEMTAGRHGTIVNIAMTGEILSLQGLESTPSRTTAITVEPSFVCVIPWNTTNRYHLMSPWVVGEFMQLIAKAGLNARESLTLVRDKEAPQRVAGFLLNMLARTQILGVRTHEFRLGMNRDDIANYLGIRSETVSRCLSELARRQVIRVKAKRVQILQLAELRRIYAGT